MAENTVAVGSNGTWKIIAERTGGNGVSNSTVRVRGIMINGGITKSFNNNGVSLSISGEASWSSSSSFSIAAGASLTIIDQTFTVNHTLAKNVTFTVNLGNTNTTTFGSGGSVSATVALPTNATKPAPPNKITISAVTGASVSAVFTDGANGGLDITARRIGYGTNSSSPTTHITYSGATTISGLAADTVYYFWPQTQNSLGWSDYGPKTSQRTDSIPGNPSTPVASNIDKDSATITFSDNADNGGETVTLRRIYYSSTNNLPSATAVTYSGPTAITGLNPKTTYYLWSRTFNSVGWSNPSLVGSFRTLAVPEPPNQVIASNIWQTRLDYAFNDGANNGASITARQIAYSTTPTGTKIGLPTGLSGTLTNLPPGTTLYLFARTYNSQGWGGYSVATVVRTVAGAYVRNNLGIPKEAIPYQKVSGVWKLLEPYARSSGIWRKTGR